MPNFSAAQQFFFDNAGFSYDPQRETEDAGKARCAAQLADAELRLREAIACGVASVQWVHDADGWRDRSENVESVECCLLFIGESIAASLGAIEDADDNVRRVTEAELALEADDALAEALRGYAATDAIQQREQDGAETADDAAELRDLVRRARELIDDAMSNHIYNAQDGEEPDADCQFAQFLRDADAALNK